MSRQIINTWDQLMAAIADRISATPVAIGSAVLPYDDKQSGWYVWSPVKPTDPTSAWYHCGCKYFSIFAHASTRSQRKAAALVEAMKWADDNYGPFEWAKNKMGDYIPADINKAFPLRKEPK